MLDGRVIIRARNLLYTDQVGHDACCIGAVAAREGKPSHEVVKKSLLALRNMEHRGGVCGLSGDGAGITFQLPQPFFRDQAKRLNLDGAKRLLPEDLLGLGVVFFHDADGARRDRAKAIIEGALVEGPVQVLGWREVPTRPDVLPPESRATMPAIEQLVFK